MTGAMVVESGSVGGAPTVDDGDGFRDCWMLGVGASEPAVDDTAVKGVVGGRAGLSVLAPVGWILGGMARVWLDAVVLAENARTSTGRGADRWGRVQSSRRRGQGARW